jgi:hypothetical protein
VTTLIRESDECFRERPLQGQALGLAYYRFQGKLTVMMGTPRRRASNVSDSHLSWERNDYSEARREALRNGQPLPSPPMPLQGRDAERIRLVIEGNGSSHDRLSLIDKNGAQHSAEVIYVRISHNTSPDNAGIAFYQQRKEPVSGMFYFDLRVSEERIKWLWEEINIRPDAEFQIEIEFKAFQHEADEALWEPPQRRSFFLEAKRVTRIDGVSFHVVDSEPTEARLQMG